MARVSIAALRAAGATAAEILNVCLAQEKLNVTPQKAAAAIDHPRQLCLEISGPGIAASRTPVEPKVVSQKAPIKARAGDRTPWPSHDSCPPEWREAVMERSDAQVAYAFGRFKNWVEQNDARFVGERGWKAAWRNCAGKEGWAFENRARMNGHAVDRRQEFADALDTLAASGSHVPGREGPLRANGGTPAAPVHLAAGSDKPGDLHHLDPDRDDLLPF